MITKIMYTGIEDEGLTHGGEYGVLLIIDRPEGPAYIVRDDNGRRAYVTHSNASPANDDSARANVLAYEHELYKRLDAAEAKYGMTDDLTNMYRHEWLAAYRMLKLLGLEPIRQL